MNRAERRRIDTHNRLFEALRSELAEKGLEATTVQAVTERADVALGTFYNHFVDKEAAIRSLAELEFTGIRLARSSVDGHVETLPRIVTTTVALLTHRALIEHQWIRCIDALTSGGWWPGDTSHARYVALAAEARDRGIIGLDDSNWAAQTIERLLSLVVHDLADRDVTVGKDPIISEFLLTLLGALGVAPDLTITEIEFGIAIPTRSQWPGADTMATSIDVGMSRI